MNDDYVSDNTSSLSTKRLLRSTHAFAIFLVAQVQISIHIRINFNDTHLASNGTLDKSDCAYPPFFIHEEHSGVLAMCFFRSK